MKRRHTQCRYLGREAKYSDPKFTLMILNRKFRFKWKARGAKLDKQFQSSYAPTLHHFSILRWLITQNYVKAVSRDTLTSFWIVMLLKIFQFLRMHYFNIMIAKGRCINISLEYIHFCTDSYNKTGLEIYDVLEWPWEMKGESVRMGTHSMLRCSHCEGK